jgi:hypothetical protein
MAFNPARLSSLLLNTGLSIKDPPLYQFLNSLLQSVQQTTSDITNITNNSTSTTINNSIINQILMEDGDGGGDDGLVVPGPVGLTGANGSQGPMGPMGAIIFPPDAEDGDIFPPIVGPQGNPGITGSGGPVGPMLVADEGLIEEVIFQQYTTVSSSGSGLTLLEQHTASTSAELDFTTWYNLSYDEYIIEILNLIPATNGVNLRLRFSTDGGSSYDSGNNYQWAGFRASKAGSAFAGASATSFIGLDASGTQSNTTVNAGVCGRFIIYNPASTTFYKKIKGEIGINDGSSNPEITVMLTGSYAISASAVNAFQLTFSSGSISSGTVRVYGVAK